MASIVVRKLSDDTKGRLRRRAVRHRRSLEAEMRAILERAAQDVSGPGEEQEPFPDWFIRMTRPGIDLDRAVNGCALATRKVRDFATTSLDIINPWQD